MAIAETGAIYKSLSFDGVTSRTYGVYITGQAVYNAPQRDVEMITIPGRNGAFALDHGRFENIEVTYPAGIFADNETDFAQGISDFRNYLCSRKGYVRLSDEYNPDEYRLAVYKSGLEVDPAQLRAGEFDITFECKPQRFLTSGEVEVTIGTWGDTETESGAIVSIDNDGSKSVKSLTADIVPVQSGSGDPSPTNVRAISGFSSVNVYRGGYNPLGASASMSETVNGITFTSNGNGIYRISGVASATASSSIFTIPEFTIPPSSTHTAYFNNSVGSSGVALTFRNGSTSVDSWTLSTAYRTSSTYGGMGNKVCNGISFNVQSGTSIDMTVMPMFLAKDETTTYTTSLGSTYYGGTLDVTTGTLTVEYGLYTVNENQGFTNNIANQGRVYFKLDAMASGTYLNDDMVKCNMLPKSTPSATPSTTPNIVIGYSSQYVYIQGVTGISGVTDFTSFKTWLASNNIIFTYKLATPQTYSLTSQQIALLQGTNNIWADSGDVEVEYGQNPNVLVNPTLFESSPTVKVEGYGTVSMAGQSIDVASVPVGDVFLANGKSASIEYPLSNTATLSEIVRHTLNLDNLNTGDTFTLGTSSFAYTYVMKYAGDSFLEATATSQTGTGVSTTAVIQNGTTLIFNTIFDPITFTKGTASTVAHSYTMYKKWGTSSYGTDFPDIQIAYDGSNAIVLSADGDESGTWVATGTGQLGDVNGYSTINISGEITIDLDLGEAYWVNNGEPTSANFAVNLGSDLPTLKPGVNSVTYPNTITSCKVIPKWWKV